MTDRTKLDLVLAEVRSKAYARQFTVEEIENAIVSAMQIFAVHACVFQPGFCGVIIPPSRPTFFATEIVPGLLDARRFFGNQIPFELQQKLINPSQTHDTLFELSCLGILHRFHEVRYEPRLVDGKVPDLLVLLENVQEVYVECKAEGVHLSKHHRLFAEKSSGISSVLDLGKSSFVRGSWEQGLRIEVELLRAPSSADIRRLQETVDSHCSIPIGEVLRFGENIQLSLVQREERYNPSLPNPTACLQVGTDPTELHHKNAYVAIYPWPRLESMQRQSQRRLIASARRQLQSIPRNAYGMICMQAFNCRKLLPDVHSLLTQKEFQRIPIVWLNPGGESHLVFRNDALHLKHAIFEKMIQSLATSRTGRAEASP